MSVTQQRSPRMHCTAEASHAANGQRAQEKKWTERLYSPPWDSLGWGLRLSVLVVRGAGMAAGRSKMICTRRHQIRDEPAATRVEASWLLGDRSSHEAVSSLARGDGEGMCVGWMTAAMSSPRPWLGVAGPKMRVRVGGSRSSGRGPHQPARLRMDSLAGCCAIWKGKWEVCCCVLCLHRVRPAEPQRSTQQAEGSVQTRKRPEGEHVRWASGCAVLRRWICFSRPLPPVSCRPPRGGDRARARRQALASEAAGL